MLKNLHHDMDNLRFLPRSEIFQDFTLEREFRTAFFERDKHQMRILLGFCAVLLTIVVSYNFYDQSIYTSNIILPKVILSIEAISMVGAIGIILLMPRIEDYLIFDIIFFVLMIMFSVLTLYDNIIRPPDYIGAFYMCNFIIYYAFVPVPTRYQAPAAMLLSVGMIITLLFLKEPNYTAQVTLSIVSIIFLNISCHIMAVKLGRSKRESFLALEQGKRAATLLKRIARDISSLAEIYPLCSSCLKIRDEKGYWLDAGSFLSMHAHTHSSQVVCPECNQRNRKLVPDKL